MLISDGHVCKSEFDILKQLGAERKLGLEPLLLPHIVHTLCEELLLGGFASGSPLEGVDESALAALMAEVSDPVLQKTVLHLRAQLGFGCENAIEAKQVQPRSGHQSRQRRGRVQR